MRKFLSKKGLDVCPYCEGELFRIIIDTVNAYAIHAEDSNGHKEANYKDDEFLDPTDAFYCGGCYANLGIKTGDLSAEEIAEIWTWIPDS